MTHKTVKDLLASLEGVVQVRDSTVEVLDERRLRDRAIDALVWDAVFGTEAVQAEARWLIWELGQALGIKPASIHDLYMARGRGEFHGLTVPAMNLRGMTYDMARAVFRAALKHRVGAFIFEIARSEIGYTQQPPAEYTCAVLAAAIKEGFRGPLFVQGDHFQLNPRRFRHSLEEEVGVIKELIREAIAGGFYNIDIDASTLVDLSQPTVDEQQRVNYELSAELSDFVRSLEPEGVTISLGGEIGEVGGKNSTEEELRAYLDGYDRTLAQRGADLAGLSKVSIQTGTTHGGVVLPDGSIARVKLDFDTLERLSRVAREEYGLSGAVQHGASTLPEEAFDKFPQTETAEVHLATAFQNIIYEHPALPDELRQEVYAYLKEAHADERKEGQTDEQFVYKTRKMAFGPFKAQWWGLPADVRQKLGESLEDRFGLLFRKLNVVDTVDLVRRYVSPPTIHKTPADFG
ncbi:MAG: class II fructose-bisphosphate aldolase [Anaerolineae bacterium]